MSFGKGFGAFALLVALAGCGTVGNVVGSVTGGGGGGSTAAVDTVPEENATIAQAAGARIVCPAVQIRSGTQGVTRYAGGSTEPSAVRHQFSILRTARDCRFQNNTLFLRIGVAGRVVLGPSGAPGTLSAPIRFVVARGGVEPVYSEVQTATVTVPAGATSAEFDLVQPNIQVAVRTDETVGNFQLFVGFDE